MVDLTFYFLFNFLVRNPRFQVQTHPIGLISSNDIDFTNRELLARRWCRNPTFLVQSLDCDTKRWFCVAGVGGQAPPSLRHKTRGSHNANLVCANPRFCVAGGGVMPHPCRDTKQQLCVGCHGHGPTPPQDKIWTSMALQHEFPPQK